MAFWGLQVLGLRGHLALDRLDPDEWLERHRLRLEKPETPRHPNGRHLIEVGIPPPDKENPYPLTYRGLMSGTLWRGGLGKDYRLLLSLFHIQ